MKFKPDQNVNSIMKENKNLAQPMALSDDGPDEPKFTN